MEFRAVLVIVLLSGAASGLDDEDNPGGPLYLTKYIKSDRVFLARKLARNQPMIGGVESYSGFLTVNESMRTNTFFWFFPAEVNSSRAPVTVWLQGGPGVSSMFGALIEIGPYQLNEGWIQKREHYWSQNMNVLFIDNPPGTGFSHTETGGYFTTETQIGEGLYEAVDQFFTLFSELRDNAFYVAGESYGGKYVPALAYVVHTKNKVETRKINLRGIAIGNGLIDPVNMLVHGAHQYQLGLIDDEELTRIEDLSKRIVENIESEKWSEASSGFQELFWNSKSQPPNLLYNDTGFTFHYNILKSFDDGSDSKVKRFMSLLDVRRTLHVGDIPFSDGALAAHYLHDDMMKSVLPWFVELVENYNVLLYSGQLDIIIPYPTTVNFLRKMSWSGAEQYRAAPRQLWTVGEDIAGYVKTVNQQRGSTKIHFTEVLVRSAGHIVPQDQPKWAHDMITRFTTDTAPFN